MTEPNPTFPFADSPAIVRAHQKDSYFESVLRSKIQEVLQIYKGQRFVNTYPEELTVAAKAAYLTFTTLLGSKTLGEEYTDLIYVNRDGKRLPRLYQKIGFIACYAILPYAISKLLRRLLARDETTASDLEKGQRRSFIVDWLSKMSYKTAIDSLMNIHIALFYLHGKYYQLSKRVFGLRYVFGHSVNEERSNGSYEVLGALIFAQLLFKIVNKLNSLVSNDDDDSDKFDEELAKSENFTDVVYGASSQRKSIRNDIDLSDPKSLPFIPEASRKCMLCLEYMRAPSATPCGHCFCWRCIIDWHKERPECPLCRQAFFQQQVITLR